MPSRSASCCCGQLVATTSAEPSRVSVCHCLACQRRTGSVFGVQAWFPADAVIVTGRAKQFIRAGDEGGRTRFNFCPHCGGTVFYIAEGKEESIAVPVGAFASPSFPAPGFSVYEERMHAWVRMPEDIEKVSKTISKP